MCLKIYTEAEARRAGSCLVTGCTRGCHFDTVRCGQGGMGLSLWWPFDFRLPDLVHILSSLFIMNITEMIGISLSIMLRSFHDFMFLLCWEIKNSWFLIPFWTPCCVVIFSGDGTKCPWIVAFCWRPSSPSSSSWSAAAAVAAFVLNRLVAMMLPL